MPSQRNIEILKKSTEILKDGKAFYFTDFTGLNVEQIERLRRELKKNQCNYLVVKNNLGLLALKNLGYEIEPFKKIFFGPTGIAIAYDDPLVPTKILKDVEGLKIKGAFVEGTIFDANGVANLAKIPSKSVLLQSVVGSLNIIGNLVNTLNGIMQNLLYTIEGIKNKIK
jgi:large subunit ribosomal protein L10|uniref:Large ribosomal subunit protein uL10 n=1 Tax=candidate division WOR-3 bacterium TaxID=2052148 RepID=A0A7V3VU72_UNCW3